VLLLVVLSSCGGGSNGGAPTVAGGNFVPIQLALHIAGQPVAQAEKSVMDKMLDMADPRCHCGQL